MNSRVRREVLARDEQRCRNCGVDRDEHRGDLHVHHIVPRAEFDTADDADQPDNLVTLCRRCHQVLEHLPPEQQRERIHADSEPAYDGAVNDVALRPIDHSLLDYLQEQAITPAYAQRRHAEEQSREYSRGYVQERLARLVRHGFAVNQYDVGLYALAFDPRDA